AFHTSGVNDRCGGAPSAKLLHSPLRMPCKSVTLVACPNRNACMRVCALLLVWLLSSLSFHARAGEAAQDEWYVWAPDEVRLYVLQVGHAEAQGSPIVVLHGGVGAEHSYLLPAFLPLADRHRFTFFDQRGSL